MRPGEPLYQRGGNQGDGDGRRFFLAIAFSVGLVFIYMTFLAPKPPPPGEQAAGDGAADAAVPESTTPPPRPVLADDDSADDDSAAEDGGGRTLAALGPDTLVYERLEGEPGVETIGVDGFFTAQFSTQGGGPSSWVLADYYEPIDIDWLPSWAWNGIKGGLDFDRFSMKCPPKTNAQLIKGEGAYRLVPSFQSGGLVRAPGNDRLVSGGTERAYVWANAGEAVDFHRWELLERNDRQLIYGTERPTWGGELEITTTYDLPESGYLMGYQVTVHNSGDQPEQLSPRFSVIASIPPAGSRYTSSMTPFYDKGGKAKDLAINKVDKKRIIRDEENPVRFAGIEERYFMTALVPHELPAAYEAAPIGWLDEERLALQDTAPIGENGEPEDRSYRSTMIYPESTLLPGQTATYAFDVYVGPKVLGDMKELGLGLEDTVQYGLFSIIARPMLFMLTLFHSWIGNWGLAIILLTVVVKALVFPLDQASYKSMKKMRVLAPRMQEIRDQFKNDPQRQQQEIMSMYKEAGANPFSGCFPMLIQMPIWFALYRVLWGSIELYQEHFLYFCDLTARDPICIFPVALSGIMFVQQKMSPPPTDPNQKMMMQFMPLFFAFIMFALPSGLVLYILVSSCLRLLQQWLVNRSGDPETESAAAAGK